MMTKHPRLTALVAVVAGLVVGYLAASMQSGRYRTATFKGGLQEIPMRIDTWTGRTWWYLTGDGGAWVPMRERE